MNAKGYGCVHLTYCNFNGGRRRYKLCRKRPGLRYSSMKCVGKDAPECPGFQPLPDLKGMEDMRDQYVKRLEAKRDE